MTTLIFKLLCGHAIADICIQGDFVAKFKNRSEKFFTGETIWPYVLGGHSLFHGALVMLATGSVHLGMAETAAHFAIDFGKGEKWYGFHVDQFLHIFCKLLWAYLALKL